MAEKRTWRCGVCGYAQSGEAAPDVCPICAAAADEFELYIEAAAGLPVSASQWRCLNCDYVSDGESPPEACPICGVPGEQFEPVKPEAPAGFSDFATRIVIIGGGIAGVAAAESARQTAHRAEISLVCQEPVVPYYRLNLTRYLAGDIECDALPIHPPEWYVENNIELFLGRRAVEVSKAAKSVVLDDESALKYDKLILATGSHAFAPPLPGVKLVGVFSLRTAADADALLERVGKGGRCVVIGGGILGIETAGALARRGVSVTLLESHQWLMPRQLNRKAAAVLENHIAATGVEVLKSVRTREILGDGGQVSGVSLEDGARLAATCVVMTTGVRCNTALARKMALEVDTGVVVNNRLLASDPDIFAAGDLAEHNAVLYGSWAVSQYQGKIAGLNAAGVAAEFGGLPRSNSLKILGVDMFSVGRFEPEDGSYHVLESGDDTRLRHFVFHDGRIVGAILIGHPELGMAVKRAVENGRVFPSVEAGGLTIDDVVESLAAGQGAQPAVVVGHEEKQTGGEQMSTTENLAAAFAGESQANRTYLAFAKKAEVDGFPQVAKLFRAAAEAETVHAHAHLRVMGTVVDTAGNLKTAAAGEAHEHKEMYPEFIAVAEREDNKPALTTFKNAMAVEKIHDRLYNEALAAVETGKDIAATQIFVCSICGNTVMGAPQSPCGVCGVPAEKFFEIK